MKSRFEPSAAARLTATLAGRDISETQALRTYTSRLLGADPALVLHGGGNTSAKAMVRDRLGRDFDVLYIKGSGWDLATIEPEGLPAVRMAPLLALRDRVALSDEDMVNELRLALLDAAAPTPSVETLLHAFLPAKYIDHTHADAILAIADQARGEDICRSIFGDELVWVPYVMPGFELAKRCAEAYEAARTKGSGATVIVLERHGVFTFGDTAEASYEKMIEVVTRAEQYIAEHRADLEVKVSALDLIATHALLPRLRGALARLAGSAPERGPILTLRSSVPILRFLARSDAADLAARGCATPDHVIRTKPAALFVSADEAADPEKLTGALESKLVQYAHDYEAYFAEMCAKKGSRKKLDPWPRVLLVPGIGVITVGKTARDAAIAADIYEHTITVIEDAEALGAYAPVSREDLFDVEYWSLEQAKIKKVADAELAGKIVVVTGAGSGIGKATAERFLQLGAHVVMGDRDAEKVAAAHAELERYADHCTYVSADVTDETSVAKMFDHALMHFGGVDVVVSNAGNAPEGRLDTGPGHAALAASLQTNLYSHASVAKRASEIFLAQRNGGALLFNASKAAFNPGPNFGPYAVAKSALVALMRQYAIDLGKFGVRSNAVNADRVRTGLFSAEIVERRSKARGLSPDAYFQSNLLEREVTVEDVANAFAYLATARSTTGCVVTVDGGNAAAFPR